MSNNTKLNRRISLRLFGRWLLRLEGKNLAEIEKDPEYAFLYWTPPPLARGAIGSRVKRTEEQQQAYNNEMNRLDAILAEFIVANGTDALMASFLTERHHNTDNQWGQNKKDDWEGPVPSTLSTAVSAFTWIMKTAGGVSHYELPLSRATLQGFTRLPESKSRGNGQRQGITWEEVATICGIQEGKGTLRGLRNSCILRVMSDGMLRVSEAANIRVEDFTQNGLVITRSKTDQEGEGDLVYLCDITAI